MTPTQSDEEGSPATSWGRDGSAGELANGDGFDGSDQKPSRDRPADEIRPEDLVLEPSEPIGYAWKVLFIVLLALLAHGSTMTIIGASLKQISDDLDTSETLLAWTLTGAFLAQAIGTTIAGKLGDLYGHRRVYIAGSSLFVLGLFCCGFAWDPISLIGFRILSGLGGSMTTPTGMAMMLMAFPVNMRPRALGWFHAVVTGGPALGLAVGGSVVDILGWRSIFFLYGPVALMGGIFAYFVFRTTERKQNVSVDYVGSVLLAVTATGLLLGIDRGASWGFGSAPAVLLLGIGVAAFIVFLGSQTRLRSSDVIPLVPLKYFRLMNYTGSAATSALANFVYMGGFVVTPLLLQYHFGIELAVVTLFLLIRPMSFSMGSPVGGILAKNFGERFTTMLGSACMVVSMLAFAASPQLDMLWLAIAGLALSGACLGFVMPSLQLVISEAVPPDDLGVAMGVTQTLSSIAVATGIQTLLLVLGEGRSPGDFTTAYLVGCGISVFAIYTSSLITSSKQTAI